MMLKKKAEKLNIESISDLKKHKNLRFGFDHEFISREEFEILKREYDLQLKKIKVMDHILLYLSLSNDGMDVIDGYTTDAGILYYDLKILEDVKNVLPRHMAIPLVRGEVLEKYPYLSDIINRLGGNISNEEMQRMNYEMDYEGRSAKNVAEKFLKKKNLLE
jgi:glycine betaine/choline ABC-type transport system substrate-binding protein